MNGLISAETSNMIEKRARRKRIEERKKKTYLGIEHLALRTQPIAFRHQCVNLLAPLQHALNRLVQHNLCLVELLLNLHDAVGLFGILVLGKVIFELRERDG